MIVVTKFGHMLETLRMLWYYESSKNPKTMQTISRKGSGRDAIIKT